MRLAPFALLSLLAACTVPVVKGLDPDQEPGLDDSVVPETSDDLDAFLPGHFLVHLGGLDSSALQEHLAGIDGDNLEQVDGLDATYRFTSSRLADEVVEHLEGVAGLDWVEPRIAVHSLAAPPNDPYYIYQWNLQLLDAPTVWERSTGSGVVVAVVDTGVAPAWDAFADLRDGADFVSAGNGQNDANGHGSHVAGTIAQGTHNGIGVSGLAYDAAILPVRVLDENGSGTSDAVAAGIRYAVDAGADVINLSLGSSAPSQVIEDACTYAAEADVLVFAASGNDGYLNFVSYPAAYDTTIAVGATDSVDGIAPYSNGGAALDLVAPGGNTAVDLDGDGYADGILNETTLNGEQGFYFLQGTSMAAPHGAAAGAVLLAAGASPAEVKGLLTSTAVDLGVAGRDDDFGAGRIDLVAALDAVGGGTPTEPIDLCPADRCADDLVAGDLLFTEIMADPSACSDATGEWLEVVNLTDGTVQLEGLTLTDASGRSGTLTAGTLVAGAHGVLGRGDAQSFCGSGADATYGSSVSLNNTGDQVFLANEAGVIAESVAWSGSTRGTSLELAPMAYAAPSAADWSDSTTPIEGTDELGSPGAAASGGPAVILDIDDVLPGELTLTEYMANPAATSDTTGEWIEVRNDSAFAIDLDGLQVADLAKSRTVAGTLVLAAGERAVLGRGDGESFDHPDVQPAGFYDDIALNNSGETLTLANATQTLDTASWTSSGGTSGVSMELVDGAWAKSTHVMNSGDLGTPGF